MVGHWYIMLFDPEMEYHGAGDESAQDRRLKAKRNKEAVSMILIVASLIEAGIE